MGRSSAVRPSSQLRSFSLSAGVNVNRFLAEDVLEADFSPAEGSGFFSLPFGWFLATVDGLETSLASYENTNDLSEQNSDF